MSSLNYFPTLIETGDDVSFTVGLCGPFTASLYTARYALNQLGGSSPVVVNGTTAPDGISFSFSIPSATTSTLATGAWNWAVYATAISGGARSTAQGGALTVIPSLLTASAPSTSQTMVSTLEGALAALAASQNKEVNFNGQMYEKQSIKEYQSQLVYWQSRVIQEQRDMNALRGDCVTPGNFRARFVPATSQQPYAPYYNGPY